MSNATRSLRRLFFGFEVSKDWSRCELDWPSDKNIIDVSDRHMTLAFLGDVDADHLLQVMATAGFPTLQVPFACSGLFAKTIPLPSKKKTNVIAWKIEWLDRQHGGVIEAFRSSVYQWLQDNQIATEMEHPKKRPFLPHVSLVRWPSRVFEWSRVRAQGSVIISHFHLFESKDKTYTPLWSRPLQQPFERLSSSSSSSSAVAPSPNSSTTTNSTSSSASSSPSPCVLPLDSVMCFVVRWIEPSHFFYNALAALLSSFPYLPEEEPGVPSILSTLAAFSSNVLPGGISVTDAMAQLNELLASHTIAVVDNTTGLSNTPMEIDEMYKNRDDDVGAHRHILTTSITWTTRDLARPLPKCVAR